MRLLLLATLAMAQTPPLETRWHPVTNLPLEGKGWTQTKHLYDRLPTNAEGTVRSPVWSLGRNSAGLAYRFTTSATRIHARWKLRPGGAMALPHMPATGVSGLDLYVRDAGEWRWTGYGRPDQQGVQEKILVHGLDRRKREFLLYLPLYNSLDTLEIGLPPGDTLDTPPARPANRRPIVFYGTSILQGGCASRPGMAYPSILGRMLDWPTINLGFSGNGKSEPEIARLLAELDPAAYVLDSLPNLTVAETAERVPPFIQVLRERHPATPIILVEHVQYTDSGPVSERRVKPAGANAALRSIFNSRKKAGDSNIYYVGAWQLFGGDGEDTVDGVHPTDLGFLRMAQGMAPVLREILNAKDDGFTPLFDGQTLSGWKVHDGLPKEHQGGKWWVEDGVLNGTQDPPGKGGFLWLDRKYGNFILKMEAKLDYPVDSGVFVRVGPDGKSHQITLDYRPGSDIGAIYLPWTQGYVARNPEGVRALRKDEWNDIAIRVEGEPARIRLWLNGYLLTDFLHTEATTKGVPASGGIALQVHPDAGKLTLWKGGNRVRFRSVRIKELD
ncbi:MAG: DUF1080 domain-containing protein [Acidobacteria bacterium]|nr:DUF1080 domain-containing protein [Acidobacteriota bacterium]